MKRPLLFFCMSYISFLFFVVTQGNRDSSLASPLASYVSGHTLEVTGGAGI